MKVIVMKNNPEVQLEKESIKIIESALIHIIGLHAAIVTGKGSIKNPLEEKIPNCIIGLDVYLDPTVGPEATQEVKTKLDNQLNLFLQMAEVEGKIEIRD